ncbi:MAG: hypothetical protein FWC64_02560 [Treponema sp.]|nr:hypothetical protein [Treponema sp.]
MKRAFIFVSLAVLVVFTAASCRSVPPEWEQWQQQQQQQQQQWEAAEPPFIQEVMSNPPDDAYVGIGTARAGNLNMARQIAENRARVSIAQQIDSSVMNMIEDYAAGSDMEPEAMLSFQQTVSRTLAEADLRGTRPYTRTFRDGNAFEAWTIMTMPRVDANNTIAAALAPHANAALWALDRMDAAFEQRNAPTVVRE